MRELVEFRIPEEHAARFLQSDEGVSLGGSVRKYELEMGSPRFAEIGHFDKKLRAEGRAFYTACIIRRRYSKRELDAASLFCLKITSLFDPAGEECGTQYDESTACPRCGTGARQASPLFLDVKRIPKTKDISQTIAGEVVGKGVAHELLTS
ncbi:MAG TPA: hypothetical protein VIS96_13270 [Terrimicrobiaceae bacterium]